MMQNQESLPHSQTKQRPSQEPIDSHNVRQVFTRDIETIFTQEEDQIMQKKSFQQGFLKYQICKAQMGDNPLGVLLVIHKFMFPGQIQQRAKSHRQWLIQFFKEKANLDIENGYLSPRIDAGLIQNPGTIFFNTLMLYGIDFLETHDIISAFSLQDPTVSWIDSSSCLLKFKQNQLVVQFLDIHLKDKPILNESSQLKLLNWTQIRGHTFMSQFPRKLFVKHLTQADQVYISQLQVNKQPFQNLKKARRELEYFLLKDQKIRKIYEEVLAQEIATKELGPNQFCKKKKLVKERMEAPTYLFPGDKNPQQLRKQRSKKQHEFKNNPQNDRFRHSLGYYKQCFLPQLKKQKRNKDKDKKRQQYLNSIRLQKMDIKDVILLPPPMQKQNIEQKLNKSVIKNALSALRQKNNRTNTFQNNQYQPPSEIDTSFHLSEHPPKQSQLEHLLEEVDNHIDTDVIHQTKPIPDLPTSGNIFSNINRNMHIIPRADINQPQYKHSHFNNAEIQQRNINSIFNKISTPSEQLAYWNKLNLADKDREQFNFHRNEGSFGNYDARFINDKMHSIDGNSSIPEKSNHFVNLSDFHFKTDFISSNNLSNHHFSSNSKPKSVSSSSLNQPPSHNINIQIPNEFNRSPNSISSDSGINSDPNSASVSSNNNSQPTHMYRRMQDMKYSNPIPFLPDNFEATLRPTISTGAGRRGQDESQTAPFNPNHESQLQEHGIEYQMLKHKNKCTNPNVFKYRDINNNL